MRPAWGRGWAVALTAAATLLTGCGGGGTQWLQVTPALSASGLSLTLQAAVHDDAIEPWRRPPEGSHCFVYLVRVQATDGRGHDVRPGNFRTDSGSPADAIGRCNGPQIEPTWIGNRPQLLSVTILESSDIAEPLLFRG